MAASIVVASAFGFAGIASQSPRLSEVSLQALSLAGRFRGPVNEFLAGLGSVHPNTRCIFAIALALRSAR